jgi:predicted permease
VLPPEYRGAAIDDAPVDVYVPMWTRMDLLSRPIEDFVLTPQHRHSFMTVLGRLKPGVTTAQADANLDVLARQLGAAWELDEPERLVAIPHFALNPNTRALMVRVSRLLAVVAGIVLLIACANLANLQLARATSRYRELAVRVALGASRGRIVRQLLTESVLLSGAGAVLALLASLWTTEVVATLLPLSFALEAHTDWRLIAAATAIAFVTGVLSGMVPAARASRTDIASSVKSGGRGAIDGRSPLRSALVVTQVALSCLLLVGAGLFVRTLQRVHDVALGYEVQGGLAVSLDLRPYGYGETTGTQLYQRMLDRVRALPGVRSAALGSIVPLSGAQRESGISIEGRPAVPDEELPAIDNDLTGPGYFKTMGIAMIAGRDFTERDDRSGPRVAIVNESMARRFWPGEKVLGKRFRTGNDGPWHEIVGLVRDVRHVSVDEEPLPAFYRPFAQQYYSRMQLFVRTGGDPLALVTPIREVVHDLAPRVTIPSIETLAAIHSESIRTFTTNATLISALGVLALVLAAVGLYGVLAFLVAQRTREIGVRIALGARGRDVLWQVTRQGLALTAVGLAIGAVAAWFLVRTVSDQLFEVTPRDPFAFALAVGVLLSAAVLASLVPARRASRVEPMEALRAE